MDNIIPDWILTKNSNSKKAKALKEMNWTSPEII